jgi:ribosome-binding factor A
MSHRLEQINSIIFQKLGDVFSRELEPPTSYLISISTVETAPNLKTAHVKLSVLPFDKSKEALVFIIRHKSLIQKELAKAIKMQYTPKINFSIDDTRERVSYIEKIIDESIKS